MTGTDDILRTGGETGALIEAFDWSTTPLGPRASWPTSLKTLVRTMLHTRQPMILWWGPELTQIYNDAMLESMRDKHPKGMGQPGREAWQQAWLAVGHELQRVLDEGVSIWNEDMFVPVDRDGVIDPAYWTYSYSPAFDDDGNRAGILIICTETTTGVVARKQLEAARREAVIAREEMRGAFLQTQTAIAILQGPELVFTFANPAYERLVNRPVVGRPLKDVFTDEEIAYYRPIVEKVLQTGETVDIRGAELQLASAELRYIDVAYQPYRSASGERIGVIASVTDVTASVRARLEAERRQGEAEAEARTRDEFLAMLSHELRNPLAPIATAAELMRLTGDHHPKQRVIIERQITHLTQLVDDLLDIARVTRGKMQLRRQPVDLAPVINKAIEQASPSIAARGHSLQNALAPEPILVHGDAVRLAQVFSNLLTNAARYTPEKGHIEIKLRREQHIAIVSVVDNGPGFAPELLPRVFDMFVQGVRRADRSEGGLGIGLALVKQLVTMHGGTVTADTLPEGGAKVEVRLPTIDSLIAEILRDPPSERQPRSQAETKRVLVVDDNRDAASTLAEVLMLLGHQVISAFDGPTALARIEDTTIDVAILDIGLPQMDGLELARALRKRPNGNAIRLAALTGYGQPADVERAHEAGFDKHFAKPAELAAVIRFVEK